MNINKGKKQNQENSGKLQIPKEEKRMHKELEFHTKNLKGPQEFQKKI